MSVAVSGLFYRLSQLIRIFFSK